MRVKAAQFLGWVLCHACQHGLAQRLGFVAVRLKSLLKLREFDEAKSL